MTGIKKIKLFFVVFILSFLIIPQFTQAHPGRTASDGCHYCRTNCSSWGVAYGERHCHGGYTPPSKSTIDWDKIRSNLSDETKINYITTNETTALVTQIIDGDTVRVKLLDGAIEKVRLIGIDTPETVDPRKPVECFGQEATDKLKSLIYQKNITLKRDKINDNKDIYSRLLRYIYLGDKDINAEMIKQGYAYVYLKYSFESLKMSRYKEYEKQAKDNELGLWASGVCGNDVIENININTVSTLLDKKAVEEQAIANEYQDNGTEEGQDSTQTQSENAANILLLIIIIFFISIIVYSICYLFKQSK